jgi:hypothetical protein
MHGQILKRFMMMFQPPLLLRCWRAKIFAKIEWARRYKPHPLEKSKCQKFTMMPLGKPQCAAKKIQYYGGATG